jgi:hypothetical protein
MLRRFENHDADKSSYASAMEAEEIKAGYERAAVS